MVTKRRMPWLCAMLLLCLSSLPAAAEAPKKPAEPVLAFPPTLPGGKEIVTDKSDAFLKPAGSLKDDVTVAKTPPTIDFLFYPGQTYAGNPWSNWGDSLVADGKYYASIGDHRVPSGDAFVYEYDPVSQKLRRLVDVKKLLNLPEGHYTPGKIHGRIDRGNDGWLYFSTYRGGSSATTDSYHYEGDWIIRTHPGTGKSEIVASGPIPKHGIPGSVLDPDRLIFYGGTTAGSYARGPARPDDILFFAYDLRAKKLLYSEPKRQKEYVMFAASTGRAYYVNDESELMRFDPDQGRPVKIAGPVEITGASTKETPQGFIYTIGGGSKEECFLWSLDTKTEELQNLGSTAVGSQSYVSSLDVDPSGRFVYYTVGPHGSGAKDGSPIIQFDVQTKRKKVIAFLLPFYKEKYGCSPLGSYSSALDAKGETLYVTWNVSRGGKGWDCCALSVIHIPESERP